MTGGVVVPSPPTSVSVVLGVPWGGCRLSSCPSHQCWDSLVCLGWSWGSPGGVCVSNFFFQARLEGSDQMGTPRGAGCVNGS